MKLFLINKSEVYRSELSDDLFLSAPETIGVCKSLEEAQETMQRQAGNLMSYHSFEYYDRIEIKNDLYCTSLRSVGFDVISIKYYHEGVLGSVDKFRIQEIEI